MANWFDPTAFPYVRVQNYTDNLAPPSILADEFYNPTQDDLASLYGGLLGVTCSMACDEFDRESFGAVTAGGQIGEQFTFQTGVNAEAVSTSPISPGDHGIWKIQATAASPEIIIYDNAVFPDVRQMIWSARVRFLGSGDFETVANEGVVVGMWGAATSTEPAFRWGTDAALGEWQAYYYDGADQFIGTGVPLIDDEWYNLIITRKSSDNKIRYYISTDTSAPVLVATSAVAVPTAFSFCRRFLEVQGTAGSAVGDGVFLDFFKRGIER